MMGSLIRYVHGGTMRTRTTTAAAALLLAALTACGPTADTSTDSTKTADNEAPASDSDAETAALPNFVGKGLQSAQDEAQAAGFYTLDSHDALGRGRMQALDRNWKVCSQSPAPGGLPAHHRSRLLGTTAIRRVISGPLPLHGASRA
jgi:hypothetical protein